MKIPVVELSDCIFCGICAEIAPVVFSINKLDFISVADLDSYPESEVDEAIKNCPGDCIFWEGD